MHILITRPEPDASEWRAQLEARGVTVSVDPLLKIEFLSPTLIDLDGVQALIATSRNGLRGLAASTELDRFVTKPIFVVGPGTAELARTFGFTILHEGPASARDLVGVVAQAADPNAGNLLHVCGDKLAFDLNSALSPLGFDVRRHTVYRSRPADQLQPQTITDLASGAIDTVSLMSPLSAKTFVATALDAGLDKACREVIYICLSDQVAERLSLLKPLSIRIAKQPNSSAMFTLIETLVATNE